MLMITPNIIMSLKNQIRHYIQRQYIQDENEQPRGIGNPRTRVLESNREAIVIVRAQTKFKYFQVRN